MTYSNVVATLAALVAIGTGTVYAAAQLGKNEVHSRNIAPAAVKSSDLHKNAVTSPKIRNGAVRASDIAPGVLHNDIADVTGTATGGPVGPLNVNGDQPVPLNGTTTFTPQSGLVAAVGIEGQFTYAKSSAATSNCSVSVSLLINGEESNANASPDSTDSTTSIVVSEHSAAGPIGLTDPGAPISISAVARGNSNCSADTRLDKVVVRIAQIH